MLAILAPGQGSQSPGMLSPWLEVDGTRERLTAWSELAELDLVELGTVADADAIKDTAVTQPLVVAASLLAFEVLGNRLTLPDDVVVAGHSVGELAAAAVAGVLTPDDAVALAAVRGREMAAACDFAPTGMAAVMGGEPDDVVAWLAGHDLTAANMNGAGQIVAAGPVEGIDAIAAEKPDFVRKVIKLKVAGAFHTGYMAPAQQALLAMAKTVTVSDPSRTLLSNADGARVTHGADVLERLVNQVTLPVRWDLCMATMKELGVHATAELPPAGALTGLARRELAGTTTAALKTPDDLAKVAAAITTADEE
ncbi:ACP S-malonyltransferase [Actinophytocola glycyrrhizae]|uniref:[acyl-carrier-protein] S-malonyltransferase n=1 Tax=Actinophytocola glycyrrhizae TaxID=2044873 RepID=A0ABV9SD49_9PSEU